MTQPPLTPDEQQLKRHPMPPPADLPALDRHGNAVVRGIVFDNPVHVVLVKTWLRRIAQQRKELRRLNRQIMTMRGDLRAEGPGVRMSRRAWRAGGDG